MLYALQCTHHCKKTEYIESWFKFVKHDIDLSRRANKDLNSSTRFDLQTIYTTVRGLFHGTQNVESQIIKAVSVMQHLPERQESLPDSPVKIFC